MTSGFGFFTLKEVAEALPLSKTTIKRLVRAGLIVPRYQLLSGRCYRLIFTAAEVLRFMDQYFPTPEDLGPPTNKTGSRKERAETIRRLRNLHQVSIGRVNAMRRAKEGGLVKSEPEIQEAEPVILDRPPRRGPNQAETPRDYERSLGGNRDNEEEEED